MTREEKLEKYLNHQYMYENGDPSYIHGIKVGVSWADENPKSPWISVEDRLPEPENEVIVLAKDKYIDIDQLTDDGEGNYYWWKTDRVVIWCEDDKITHWMPIPELPKEEKK